MTPDQNNEILAGLYGIADELQAVANLGLQHRQDYYERERYARILDISRRLAGILAGKPDVQPSNDFYDVSKHVSPLVGVDAAVFRNKKLLLIKRPDVGLWATPGGLVDVGETLTNAVLRELKEETGLTGKVTRLLGIFDSRLWKSQVTSQLYHVIFAASVAAGEPMITEEAEDAGFFSADNLPEMTPGHKLIVPHLFKLYNNEIATPYLDPPDKL